MVLTSFSCQYFGARRRAPPKFQAISLPATTCSSSSSEMAKRTRPHAQQSDLPPLFVDPIYEQGGKHDLNNLHAEEVLEYRLGKEPMVINANDSANLGDLTCYTSGWMT